MFAILYALGMAVADLIKSRARLEPEILLLRHQLKRGGGAGRGSANVGSIGGGRYAFISQGRPIKMIAPN